MTGAGLLAYYWTDFRVHKVGLAMELAILVMKWGRRELGLLNSTSTTV